MKQAENRSAGARLTRRRVLMLLPAALLSVTGVSVLAACGTEAGGNSQQGGFSADMVAQTVAVAAATNGTMRWDRDAYTAQAGDVTFVVSNPSPITHRFGVEGLGVMADSPNIPAKKSGNFTLKGLQAGDYLIVCNYPGHRAAGMVAKLTVS